MAENKITNNVLDKLNSLLQTVDLKEVSADDVARKELPVGYYLVEIKKAELRDSKTGEFPQIMLTMDVVEDGVDVIRIGNSISFKTISGTKGERNWIFYTLKDENSVKRFVGDMLKFEVKDGESVLPKEAFLNGETLEDALDVITGMRIYTNVSEGSKRNEDGSLPKFTNIISFKRAKMLGLPD